VATSRLLLTGVALLLLGSDTSPVFLVVIETELVGDIDSANPLWADVYVDNPERLASGMPSVAEVSESAEFVRVKVDEYPQLKGDAAGFETRSSFMIDYRDPTLEALSGEIRTAYGEEPSIQELTAFVFDLITEKTTSKGWSIASEVAKDRSGDCTEHAVLLAALARAAGMPARVVVGAALVRHDDSVGAFGHAWTEILSGSQWILADATGIADVETVYYIRGGAIEDEGMGYTLGLITLLKNVGIQRVVVRSDPKK
jgi:transglutaminase-like putative cysteine protease